MYQKIMDIPVNKPGGDGTMKKINKLNYNKMVDLGDVIAIQFTGMKECFDC